MKTATIFNFQEYHSAKTVERLATKINEVAQNSTEPNTVIQLKTRFAEWIEASEKLRQHKG